MSMILISLLLQTEDLPCCLSVLVFLFVHSHIKYPNKIHDKHPILIRHLTIIEILLSYSLFFFNIISSASKKKRDKKEKKTKNVQMTTTRTTAKAVNEYMFEFPSVFFLYNNNGYAV
jgi:hypothetical protein